MGQTWPFPALPGMLKTVVGKGLGRCSGFPFPDPLDTPNTFPVTLTQPSYFLGGWRLLVLRWWWDRARCAEHAWRTKVSVEVCALLRSLCPITDVTACKKHQGESLAWQGLTSPVSEPPAPPRGFPSWHKGAGLSWEPSSHLVSANGTGGSQPQAWSSAKISEISPMPINTSQMNY